MWINTNYKNNIKMKKLFFMTFVLGMPILVFIIDLIILYGDKIYRPVFLLFALAVLNLLALISLGAAIITMPKIKKGKFRLERVPAISLGLIYPTKKDKMVGIVLPFMALTYTWK